MNSGRIVVFVWICLALSLLFYPGLLRVGSSVGVPLCLIFLVLSNFSPILKNILKVASEENIEPQDIGQFQEEIKQYSSTKIDVFAYKLAREIKGKIEKEAYVEYRWMWE